MRSRIDLASRRVSPSMMRFIVLAEDWAKGFRGFGIKSFWLASFGLGIRVQSDKLKPAKRCI